MGSKHCCLNSPVRGDYPVGSFGRETMTPRVSIALAGINQENPLFERYGRSQLWGIEFK